MNLCIATVCSSDYFAGYIPLMVYSALKANTGAMIKVWMCGEAPGYVKKALKYINSNQYQIFENQFKGYPQRVGTCNALRHILPEKEFKGYENVFISDVDFIYVKQRHSLIDYYGRIMEKTKLPYAGFRGPMAWQGVNTRIAEGTLMLKNPEWFNATRPAIEYYAYVMREGLPDSFDNKPSCSYREYGEVMLYRICKMSGLKTPETHGFYANGEKTDRCYRQIHLGDFKFNKRVSKIGKMQRLLPDSNLANYIKDLGSDNVWQKIVALVCDNNKEIKGVLKKFKKHLELRYV